MNGLALAALAGTLLPAPQETLTDDLPQKFLTRMEEAIRSRDWERVFTFYEDAWRKHAQRVVSDPERPAVKIAVPEYLLRRFSRLSPEAFAPYRLRNDARARAAFRQARDSGDLAAWAGDADRFFFTTPAGEAIDRLAQAYFGRGRTREAIFFWRRLLLYCPDSAIPREITAARVAVACQVSGDEIGLARLRADQARLGVDGRVRIGGRDVLLSSFLRDLRVDRADPGPPSRPVRPEVFGPGRRARFRPERVLNEAKIWTYDFRKPGARVVLPAPSIVRPMEPPEFPYLPAYARLGGRGYVVATDGLSVISFDPAKVHRGSTTRGVYWKYPKAGPIVREERSPRYGSRVSFTSPYIGATIAGSVVFVPLFEERKRSENNPNDRDTFEGPRRLVCLDLRSGREIWSTDDLPRRIDELPVDLRRGFDYLDRNFAISGPPLVREDRVYVGIGTSPFGEQQARVLCLDRITGRPMWCTYLAAIAGPGRNIWFARSGKLVAPLTLLSEAGGVLYIHTGLGAVAAVHPETGRVLWLSTYRQSFTWTGDSRYRPYVIRPGWAPLVHEGKVYLLPQDRYELLAFDAGSGEAVDLPPVRSEGREITWSSIRGLLGIVKGWMLLTGVDSFAVRMRDSRAFRLPLSNASGSGRGLLAGESLYLSTQDDTLAIFHGVGDWWRIHGAPWKGGGESGNLLLAGETLVVASHRIHLYAAKRSLRERYASRVEASPPHPEALYEYGEDLAENGYAREAAEVLERFLRMAEGFPPREDKVRAVRRRLAVLFHDLGASAEEGSPEERRRAVDDYRRAREFAEGRREKLAATAKIADLCERLADLRRAVREYRRLLMEGERDLFPQGATLVTGWELARNRIAGILSRDPSAFREVEDEARARWKRIRPDDRAGLYKVRRLFPNSSVARWAGKALFDNAVRAKRWGEALGLLLELRPRAVDLKHHLDVLRVLDLAGDLDGISERLALLERDFGKGDHRIDGEGVGEFVARRMRECAGRSKLTEAPLGDRLSEIVRLPGVVPPPDETHLPLAYLPLRPSGREPPAFRRDRELFTRGSSIELWDLRRKRRIWARPHPGAYLGLIWEDRDGIRIRGVVEGSPAERAGLRPDDLLLSVGKRLPKREELDRTLRELPIGEPIRLAVLRGEETVTVSCRPSPWPASSSPAVLWAAFTPTYRLVIGWRDTIACLDPESGELVWTASATGPGRGFEAFCLQGDRLIVCERPRTGVGNPNGKDQGETRLLCFDSFLGRILWGRILRSKDGGGSVEILPGRGRISVVAVSPSSGRLWVLESSNGRSVRAEVEEVRLEKALAYGVDPAGETFYVVEAPTNVIRNLRAIQLTPAELGRTRFQIALQNRFIDSGGMQVRLELVGDEVCLSIPRRSPVRKATIALFSTQDGRFLRELELPEGRTISSARTESRGMLGDGCYVVYNHSVSGNAEGGMRAFLTAFRLDRPKSPVWEAVGPVVADLSVSRYSLDASPRRAFLFTLPRGAAPGESGESPVVALYSLEKEGYLRRVFLDLSPLVDPPVVYWRGRLFVNSTSGLRILAP